MFLAVLVFLFGAGAVIGAYAALTYLPGMMARRRVELRLRDVSTPFTFESSDDSTTVVKKDSASPVPVIDKALARSGAGQWLGRFIEQSGVRTSPAALVLASLLAAVVAGGAAHVLVRPLYAVPIAAIAGGAMPFAFVMHRRTNRLNAFEEQFPEALDLLARALRAGHAFQTSLGMAGDELKAPVGPEFKKTFDQQNFGLPLRDALIQMAERVPILDVRFFVTAVQIQRDTGGNLAEILENLAHVVRERFKIRRQVRVHTAHGRFTALVLLSLPPGLAATLTFLNPEHMQPLFTSHMGQMLIMVAIGMQFFGFLWIRKVIKIEV
jgi:tight adherence protein B